MKTIKYFGFLTAGLFLTGCRMQQVPPSSVGIKFNGASGISTQLLRPELTMVGINEQMIVYPTSIKNASFVRNKQGADESIRALTIEGATLPVDITVAFHVESVDVLKAFQNFGTSDLDEIQKTYIYTAGIYAVNVVSGSRSIFDLTAKERAQFGPEVKKVLSPILSRYGITVDDVFVGEVYPSDEIQAKVSESITVRTQLDTAKNDLERARIDAGTTATNARRQAEISRLLASQGEKAIALRKQEVRKKAIQKWREAGGAPSVVGGSKIPFTNIDLK